MISLRKILELTHIAQQYGKRFEDPNLLTPQEKKELNDRFNLLKPKVPKFQQAAVLLYRLNRVINFNPEQDLDTPLHMRDSNGDHIWVVIRDGRLITIFARRSSQFLDYWEDPIRGNVRKENLYIMLDSGELTRIPYHPNVPIRNIVKNLK